MYQYSHHLRPISQKLRNTTTPPENRIWYDFLRKQKPRWTRQKPLGPYIADFYCSARNMIIEIDGNIHNEQIEYDRIRDEVLQGLGVEVIRIPAVEVYQNFSGVCEYLKRTFDERSS